MELQLRDLINARAVYREAYAGRSQLSKASNEVLAYSWGVEFHFPAFNIALPTNECKMWKIYY